jgi:hypothetical protein
VNNEDWNKKVEKDSQSIVDRLKIIDELVLKYTRQRRECSEELKDEFREEIRVLNAERKGILFMRGESDE